MTRLQLASSRAALGLGLALTFATTGCSSEDDDDGMQAEGGTTSGGMAAGGASATGGNGNQGGAGAGETIPTFNGCDDADYQDASAPNAERTVLIAAQGLTYTPKCLLIAAGQTVRWQGSLAAHPLAPGNPEDALAGSADSPIVERSSGQEAEFAFEVPGTFPYYCTVHAFGSGNGMAGVVHVR